MQHAGIVRGVKAGTDLTRELNGFIDGKTAHAPQKRRELFTLDVFHRQKVASICFTDVVNATDVLVTDLSRHAHFTMKAGERSAVAQELIGKKLEGDGLAQLEIFGAVDLTHSALAEQTDDSISLAQDSAGNETRVVDRVVRLSGRLTAVETPGGSVVGCHRARILAESACASTYREDDGVGALRVLSVSTNPKHDRVGLNACSRESDKQIAMQRCVLRQDDN